MPKQITINKDDITKLSDTVQDVATESVFSEGKKILNGKDVLQVFNQVVNPLSANDKQGKKNEDLWDIYSNNIVENYEGYLDATTDPAYDSTTIKSLKYIRDAITVRHDNFKISPTYSNDCKDNIEKTMEEFKLREIYNFNQINNIFNGLKNSYEIAGEYNKSMNLIKNTRLNELKNIKSKLDTYEQNLNIDNRKNNYNSENYEIYKSIYFYVLIVYYFLLGLYFIYSDFFTYQKYKNKYYLFGILIYILFPYLLNYILFFINNMYIYFLEFNNLKEEVVSYPDIVNKYHKQ